MRTEVEVEAVLLARSSSAAERGRFFEQHDLGTGFCHGCGSDESGDAASDYDSCHTCITFEPAETLQGRAAA
jgi:hypothetical protein